MRPLVVSVALLAAVACGRYGFEPRSRVGTGGDAAGDGVTPGDAVSSDGAAICQWLTSCMAGAFTCCQGSTRTCVQNLQQCPGGNATQCDVNPPYTPCGGGEICCIMPPETYPRCIPNAGTC